MDDLKEKKYEVSQGLLELNNVNMVTSITDFNIHYERKSSTGKNKFNTMKQTSIENMDLLTLNEAERKLSNEIHLPSPKALFQIKEENEQQICKSTDKGLNSPNLDSLTKIKDEILHLANSDKESPTNNWNSNLMKSKGLFIFFVI